METSQHAYHVYAPESNSGNSHNYYGLPTDEYSHKHISTTMLVTLIVWGLCQRISGNNTTGSIATSAPTNAGATSSIPSTTGSGTMVSTGATETTTQQSEPP